MKECAQFKKRTLKLCQQIIPFKCKKAGFFCLCPSFWTCSSYLKSRWELWSGRPLHNFIWCASCTLSWIRSPFKLSLMPQLPHSSTTATYFIWGYLRRPPGMECNVMSADRHALVCPCNSSASWATQFAFRCDSRSGHYLQSPTWHRAQLLEWESIFLCICPDNSFLQCWHAPDFFD